MEGRAPTRRAGDGEAAAECLDAIREPPQARPTGGARAAEYVQRIDRVPIQTTTNRKLALAMGRFTAEDAVKSIQNSRCNPELISVLV